MSIVVYWLEPTPDGEPVDVRCQAFGDDELKAALDWVEARRRAGMLHVSLSTDFSHHVGKPGVAAVEDGKTPDGHSYEWSKAGRAGKPRKR